MIPHDRSAIVGHKILRVLRGPWEGEEWQSYRAYIELGSGAILELILGAFTKDHFHVIHEMPADSCEVEVISAESIREFVGQTVHDVIESEDDPILSLGVALENGKLLALRDTFPLREYHLMLSPIPNDAASIWS